MCMRVCSYHLEVVCILMGPVIPVPTNGSDTFKTEESFPVNADSYTTGQLPSGDEGDILLNTSASKHFMFLPIIVSVLRYEIVGIAV